MLAASADSSPAAAPAPSESPHSRRASTSGARSWAARTGLSVVPCRPRCSSAAASGARPSARRSRASARSEAGSSSRPRRRRSASRSRPPQDTELGQRGDGRRAHLRDVAGVDGERALQRVLGLRPLTGGQQHVGMDGPAGTEERLALVRAGELADELAPLAPALPLAGTRAALDEVAVGLGERVHVARPARRRGDHRLLEQAQSVLPTTGAHDRPSEQAQGEHLEVTVARGARDLDRQLRLRDLLLHAHRVPRPLHRDPPPTGGRRSAGLDSSLRPGQPAARRGRPATGQVLVGHPDRDACCVVAVPGTDVAVVRALALGDAFGDAPEHPQRQPEALVGLGLVDGSAVQRRLERSPCCVPVRLLQRAGALAHAVAAAQDRHGCEYHRGRLGSQASPGGVGLRQSLFRWPAGTPSRTCPGRACRGSTCRRTGRAPSSNSRSLPSLVALARAAIVGP